MGNFDNMYILWIIGTFYKNFIVISFKHWVYITDYNVSLVLRNWNYK